MRSIDLDSSGLVDHKVLGSYGQTHNLIFVHGELPGGEGQLLHHTVLGVKTHLLYDRLVEPGLLLTLSGDGGLLNGADVVIVMMESFLFGKQCLELFCAVFKDLDLCEVPVLLECLPNRLLEFSGLLPVTLVHLDLEINWLILIRKSERRQRDNLVVRELATVCGGGITMETLEDVCVVLSLFHQVIDF